MKIASFYIWIILLLFPVILGARTLDVRSGDLDDLVPFVCIVDDNNTHTFGKVWDALIKEGAYALNALSPNIILGYTSNKFNKMNFYSLPVKFIRSPSDINPNHCDPYLCHVISNFFRERKDVQNSKSNNDKHKLLDLVFEVPDEVVKQWKYRGPRKGSPSEIMQRGINQNSELMIGTILVNVVFPESNGGEEDWTDDELRDAYLDIVLGLEQYQQNVLWMEPLRMDFVYNFYTRIPVTLEPIMGDWNTDPIWITEAMLEIDPSYPNDAMWGTHAHNNATREAFERDYGVKVDWVFTAFVADASNNYCWQGQSGGYASYAYLGGPYMVICYPPCRFVDQEFGFSHVFMHDMSHIFWALDEYASAETPCSATSGYMNVPNRNTRYNPCQSVVDCIMNNAELNLPIPVCEYTLGQVGINDNNFNEIPDVYEIYPEWISLDVVNAISDTVYSDTCLIYAEIRNNAIPNTNPNQEPEDRIDYAPWLVGCEYWIGAGPKTRLLPADSTWDQSNEELAFAISGLTHGDNLIYLEVENCAGLKTATSIDIHAVATFVQGYSAKLNQSVIEIAWVLNEYSEDSQLFVLRLDNPNKDFKELSTLEIYRVGFAFEFYDRSCEPGSTYIYRVEIEDGAERYALFETDPITVPALALTLYPNYPNPFNPTTTIRYYLPENSWVCLVIYDVSGKLINTLVNKHQEKGTQTAQWDGKDQHGNSVASGVYVYRLTAGKETISKKMILMK